MKWLITYDIWLRGRIKVLLDWLAEWFSITQKMVERLMIILYAAGGLIVICASALKMTWIPVPTWVIVLGVILVVSMMISYHREPSTLRAVKYGNSYNAALRFVWNFLVVRSFFPPYTGHFMLDASAPMLDIAFASMLYLVSVNSDGERGRRRKLAWSKLKELFTWLPDPVPEGV